MSRSTVEMEVISKAYDLVLWMNQHLEKFPKSQRFTLGDRISNRLYDVLERLIAAKYTRDRTDLLKQVNLDLEVLRFQFRLAKDQHCWSVDNYGSGFRMLDAVGRLVGGWLKQPTTEPQGASRGFANAQEPAASALRLTQSKSTTSKRGPDEATRTPVGGTDELEQPAGRRRKSTTRQESPAPRLRLQAEPTSRQFRKIEYPTPLRWRLGNSGFAISSHPNSSEIKPCGVVAHASECNKKRGDAHSAAREFILWREVVVCQCSRWWYRTRSVKWKPNFNWP